MDLLTTLVLAAWGFGAGSYVFTWKVYQLFRDELKEIRLTIFNHHETELKVLRDRIDKLEGA